MADKDFKVKNKLFINGLSNASGVLLAQNNAVDATTAVATQYGGTGTTTSPNAGQVLYSSAGSTYAPTTLADLVTGAKYQADAPSSPAVGQIWIESDSSSDSFDPNIIRRQSFTATAGQTVFTTSYTWIQGYEQVYLNGLLLLRTTDYTTSNDDTVTLVEAAALNDILEVVTVTNLNVNVGGYTQDSAPSTPVDGEIWLDTDGTLAETAYIANSIVDAKGDLITATADNTPIKLTRGTDGQYLQTDSTTATGLKWATVSSSPTGSSASVTTRQSTTSASFGDLATSGPSVTLTTGTKVLVIVTATMDNNNVQGAGSAEVDFAISGAFTRSASSETCIKMTDGPSMAVGKGVRFSAATHLTGLTAGSNTFTAKYRSPESGAIFFSNRSIFVMDMGS